MTSKEQRDLSEWIMSQVGAVNPYNRLNENRKDEYYLYQTGFLASYLASLMREDPYIYKRFKSHVEGRKKPG